MIRDRVHLALISVACVNVGIVAAISGRVFDAPYSPIWAVLATVAAAVVAVVNPARRVILRVLPQLAVCIVFTGAAVLSRHGNLFPDLVHVPFQGLGDIVAARWPAPSEPVSVGALVLAVAVAATVTAELAWTRRYSALLLLPPIVVLLLVALLAPQAGTAPLPAVVAMVMGAALVLRLAYLARVQRQHQTSMPSERGSNALVGSVIALVALVPAAIGAPFGSTDRFDIREQSENADSIAEEISPLSRLDEWRGGDTPTTLFTVSPAVTEGSQDWRFVALTRYDGSAWMPSSDFRPVGEVLGKADRTPTERYEVSIDDFEEQWAPFAGLPLETSLESRVDDTVSGIRLTKRFDSGDTYRVSLTEPNQQAERLRKLVADQTVELPSVAAALGPDAEAFGVLANEIIQNSTNDFDRASAIATYLSKEFTLSTDAPAGHRLAQLRVFLTSKKSGRDEQFVAAFALLARLVGLPARVVVGVELTTNGDASSAVSSNVKAWPEVAFPGAGWVAFDPLPTEVTVEESTGGQQTATPAGRQVLPPPTTAAPVEQSTTSVPLGKPTGTILPVERRLVAGGLLLLLAAAAYVAVILNMKRNRRLRRSEAQRPDERVTGAFLTNVEQAVDLGAPVAPHLTNHELARQAAAVLGEIPPSFEGLATLATRVVYDRHMPTEETAEAAWAEADRARAEMREAVGRARWTRARLSVRSLRIGRLEQIDPSTATATVEQVVPDGRRRRALTDSDR